MSIVEKCVMASHTPPDQWTSEILEPCSKQWFGPIFGHNWVAMDREGSKKLIESLGWTHLCESLGDARKAIRAGAVRVNRMVVKDIEFVLDKKLTLPCDAIVIEFGRYNFGVIELC
jgi:tyrosyl-tRNA synthetase